MTTTEYSMVVAFIAIGAEHAHVDCGGKQYIGGADADLGVIHDGAGLTNLQVGRERVGVNFESQQIKSFGVGSKDAGVAC